MSKRDGRTGKRAAVKAKASEKRKAKWLHAKQVAKIRHNYVMRSLRIKGD